MVRSRFFMMSLAALAMVLGAFAADTSFAADGKWSGKFRGASNHVTSGSVTVSKKGGKITLQLGSNFSLDGAPDPWIGFGKNGKYKKATQFTKLRSKTGRQTYSVPASVDLGSVNEVYIWCHKFSVPLGVARIR